MRPLAPRDADELHRFHEFIHRTLRDDSALYRRDREFFEDVLRDAGRIVGVFAEDRLIAYATICYRDVEHSALAPDLRRPLADGTVVAQFEGAAVHPDFRGNRLHYRMGGWRMVEARRGASRHVLVVVSPASPYSLRSHLRHRLRVGGITVDEDGPNFLLHRDLEAPPTSPEPPFGDVALADFGGHRAMLDRGLEGFAVEGGEEEVRVRYGAREGAPEEAGGSGPGR